MGGGKPQYTRWAVDLGRKWLGPLELGPWTLDAGSWIFPMDQTTIQVQAGERKVGMCKWHSILHCNSTLGSPPPETREPLSDRDLDRRKGLPPTPTSS